MCHDKKEHNIQPKQFTELPRRPVHRVAIAEENYASDQKPKGALLGRFTKALAHNRVSSGLQQRRDQQ